MGASYGGSYDHSPKGKEKGLNLRWIRLVLSVFSFYYSLNCQNLVECQNRVFHTIWAQLCLQVPALYQSLLEHQRWYDIVIQIVL